MKRNKKHSRGENVSELKSITEEAYSGSSRRADCSLKISKWITAEEAAEYLRLSSVAVLRNMVCEKRVPYYKLGRLLRFKVSDLDALLESSKIERRYL